VGFTLAIALFVAGVSVGVLACLRFFVVTVAKLARQADGERSGSPETDHDENRD